MAAPVRCFTPAMYRRSTVALSRSVPVVSVGRAMSPVLIVPSTWPSPTANPATPIDARNPSAFVYGCHVAAFEMKPCTSTTGRGVTRRSAAARCDPDTAVATTVRSGIALPLASQCQPSVRSGSLAHCCMPRATVQRPSRASWPASRNTTSTARRAGVASCATRWIVLPSTADTTGVPWRSVIANVSWACAGSATATGSNARSIPVTRRDNTA